jgi:hypothetical protein
MIAEYRDGPSLREELLGVVTALWFEIDHRNGTRASEFFTADAELRFSARIFRGTAQIDAVYASRAARGPRVSRHIVTNLHVTSAGADRASAVSAVILFADDGEAPRPTVTPAMVGDVADEFEWSGDRWLIRSRGIDNLFIAPTTALAVPTQ